MVGDTAFLSALVTALQSDVNLVTLTGHTSSDPRIFRGFPAKSGKTPALAVLRRVSTPVIKEHTFIKRYLISLIGCGGKEFNAIQISDRVEELVHVMNIGSAVSYYNFSNADVTVYSTLWKSRVQSKFDEEVDYFKDENIIEIVANPFNSC